MIKVGFWGVEGVGWDSQNRPLPTEQLPESPSPSFRDSRMQNLKENGRVKRSLTIHELVWIWKEIIPFSFP